MRIKKSSGLIALICTLISISWLFFKKELTLSTISDALFLWALFFLIIGGFLWVFASGFFDHLVTYRFVSFVDCLSALEKKAG